MRYAGRILIGAVLLLAVAGGLVIAVQGDRNIGNMRGLSYEMKTFEVNEAFSDIRIEDVECSVRILPAVDGKCRVVCPEKRDGSIYHTVAVIDGALCVHRHDRRRWYQFIHISLGNPEVEVYLPEGAYGELAFHSVSGSLRVEDGFTFENARLESTSGRIAMDGASPETLAAESISGRIALSRIRSAEISARTTSGRIELTDVIAEDGLYARSVSGGVSLDGCDGGTIRIETTSGSVKGTILSDKRFTAHSTSGSVVIPRSADGGECEITTTSGSIAIDIRQ